MTRDIEKEADGTGELMYVKCAYCGKWLDVKPGRMNWVSHGLCDECLQREINKVKDLTSNPSEEDERDRRSGK